LKNPPKLQFKLLILSAMIVANVASARSVQKDWTEVFPEVKINQETTKYVGVSTVDTFSKEINVKIYIDNCHSLIPPENPNEIRCKAMPSLVQEFSVTGLGPIDDGCGSVYFTGKEDLRREDGGYTEITVTDNSRRTCERPMDVILGLKVATVTYQGPRASQPTVYTLISNK
jgi:hypothetical protein